MARRLIFNADDYGLSPGVSAGIREALAAGVVRSTTVTANAVTDADLGELRVLLSDSLYTLSAGCHLNLSYGIPLTAGYPADLLKQDSSPPTFIKLRALERSTWRDRQLLPAVAAEWSAQLTYLLDRGLPVSHLDSHHHVHLLPELFMLALNLAKQHRLALRIRRNFRSVIRADGTPSPDGMLEGFYGAANVSQTALLGMLDKAAAGPESDVTEVMCHPGHVDDELRSRSSYLTEREHELQTLTDPALLDVLSARGWELASYRALFP